MILKGTITKRKRAIALTAAVMLSILALFNVNAYAASDNFTPAEMALIEASKTEPITVGIVDNSAPICYLNSESGKYEGITVDMLNAVSENTGLCFIYTSVDLSRSADATHPTEESPKLVAGVLHSKNLPDNRDWYVSRGLHSDSLAVVSKRGSDLSESRKGKTLAVMSGMGMGYIYAQTRMSDYTVIEYPTVDDCLDAVAHNRADAALYLQSSIYYLLQKPQYGKLEIVPTFSESIDVCVAGFTAESAALISIVNKGLWLVSDAQSRAIALNYTIMNPYELTAADIVYEYREAVFLIVLMIVTVIALLSRVAIIRRKSENKVKEALVLAEKASDAKGSFMSRMSHEIRTPLNAVIGYNTIARSEMTEAKTDEERRQSEMKVMDCLTKSDIASRHLLTIINDVLDMSAIESGKIKVLREQFDFKGLISSLTAVFYSQAKAKCVDFDVKFDSHMEEWVIGDQMRVNQVLTNLLSNAIKFTAEGGKVTLFIRPQTKDDSILVHFEIRDSGIGMSAEQLEKIWKPFEQADSSISRRFGGTGLGLSITKTLVDLMEGSISVKSKPGEGSVFSVDLSFGKTEQPKESGVYDFSKINALIVDDDINTCDYIRLLLTRSGVRSTAVTSGEEALKAVSDALKLNEAYTVCLVDWRMPKMDGIETIKHIREIAGDELPIIVITAYDYSEVADEAAEMGVNLFISKPLFQSSLFNLLTNIVGCPVPKNIEKLSDYDYTGSHLLLAEDNAMNMEIARNILETAGFIVDGAWNGEEAVAMFEAAPAGTYQAILMDVQMPVMDGHSATIAIRKSSHPEALSIPIIAMTADAFTENIAESLASGMNDHISKPIDLPTLFATLGRYIKNS